MENTTGKTVRSKYREERTLVRGLRRALGQDRSTFKQNVNILRRHFEQFNLDVSELCQWLMGLRPGGKKEKGDTVKFWEFMLTPEKFLSGDISNDIDRGRLMVFDVVTKCQPRDTLLPLNLSEELRHSIDHAAECEYSATAKQVIERVQRLSVGHRMILLKAAAEFVTAKYLRAMENWPRQREEWEKEKSDWEQEHPELTPDIRDKYNDVFRKLDVKEKSPHICSWERLNRQVDNCDWAGERLRSGGKGQNHSQLCIRYRDFLKNITRQRKFFRINAQKYLAYRRNCRKPEALQALFREDSQTRYWFEREWESYLITLQISEDTILSGYGGILPHCEKVNGETECRFNQHTEKCKLYCDRLSGFEKAEQDLEPVYREWRRSYLAGPRRPSFRYPSSREQSVPKIFGKGFYEVDFDNAVVRLRLDDMPAGEFLSFRFKPWPPDYEPQPEGANISSVHLHFVGTRARIGFRFTVRHAPSRFGISQDELDRLRSRDFPRVSQDQLFLNEARQRLAASFDGQFENDVRMLAVDLGTSSTAAAYFEGTGFKSAEMLKIVKIDEKLSTPPEYKISNGSKKVDKKKKEEDKKRGLTREHVGRHLGQRSEAAKDIAAKRQDSGVGELGPHDVRRLSLHIRWMIRDWVRLNAHQIIEMAEKQKVDVIVFESLRGFKAPGYDKKDEGQKSRLGFFSYGSIRRKVTEKAVERGMRVVTVPYFYSSQVCPVCGALQQNNNAHHDNKKRGRFKCEKTGCRYDENSDKAAARVLGHVFWGQIQLPARNK